MKNDAPMPKTEPMINQLVRTRLIRLAEMARTLDGTVTADAMANARLFLFFVDYSDQIYAFLT